MRAQDQREPSEPPPARRPVPRWLGFAIGVLLLAGAAVAVTTNQADFANALNAMQSASLWQWVALPAAMLGSLLLTSAVFHIFTNQYGRVRYTEMNALIGVAWTLNYLPMHPGMFGRVAYHKKINNIPVRDSMRILIWANLQTLAAVVALPAIAYIAVAILRTNNATTLAALQLPTLTCLTVALITRGSPARPNAWRSWTCLAIRCLEVELWALRYWVSFAVIGMPIPFSAAVVIAGVVILASMVALTGNGMGIQEWAVALVTPLLPAALVLTNFDHADGLIGAFLSRSAEILTAIPAGLWGMWYLARYKHN